MKKLFLICIVLIISASLPGQNILVMDPVSGRVFNGNKYSGIRGTPFLFDKWIPGSVTTLKGIYPNLALKLDAYSNILYYQKEDQSFEIQDEVRSFLLISNDTLYFKKGLSGKSLTPDQFVQVLVEGKIGLYRSDIKLISELSEINRGMIKTFTNATRYYIVKDGQTSPFRLTKNELAEFTRDQEEKVKAFADDYKLSVKKETDLVKLLRFYNSL